MSTQSAVQSSNVSCQFNCTYRERRVSLSNEAIAEAADAAFSSHSRLDVGLGGGGSIVNPLVIGSISSVSSSHFHIKKRKAVDQDSPQTNTSIGHTVNTDFLSGIFEDIANAQQARDNSHLSSSSQVTIPSDPPPTKKPRSSSFSRSLSRCPKSFACLHTVSEECMDDVLPPSNCNIKPPSSTSEADNNAQAVEAATIIDTIFDINLPLFPNLPTSVSNSSNSSNNLTQTQVQAVTKSETISHVEGSTQGAKDGYGWFVETEDDDVSSPIDLLKEARKDIAFSVAAAPKSHNHDAEIEWARAADTVDDVLADFF